MNIKARDIFHTPIVDIWKMDDLIYQVEYEDGKVVPTHIQGIVFNRYCWELFMDYPNTPITTDCDIMTLIGDGFFNIGSSVKLLERVFKHICISNHLNRYMDKEPLLKLTYEVNNRIFNEIVHGVSHAVTTIDAVDMIEAMSHEDIQNAQNQLNGDPETVERSYRAIRKYIHEVDNPNSFVKAYRAKAINDNQANQCIGPRGYVTDLDRTVYKQPIVNGFIRGMGSLYELMAESRTAAKSLNATESDIRTSEYTSRRMQLLSMSVTNPDNQDCGSTEYLDLLVTSKILPNLEGKWYLSEEGLKQLTGTETELIDKVISLRSPLYCRTHDKKKVCTKCLGSISENFKENSNLGYTFAAFLMEKLTQSILSTKHLTQSVRNSLIELEGVATKYFTSNEDNEILFHKGLDLKGLRIVLPSKQLVKLIDVMSLTHTNVALDKIGELHEIGLFRPGSKAAKPETIVVSYRDRESTITKELLTYMKSGDVIEVDSRGNFTVDMSNWKHSDPVFFNPLKEANVVLFISKLASMIEYTKKSKDNINEHFNDIVTMVYEQLQCNITILETIVYATTAFDEENEDFRLGRGSPHMRQANKTDIFNSRSMGQLFVYERQTNEILRKPNKLFSSKNRLAHPMDVLFVPEEIVK